MNVKLLTDLHFEFLSLNGGYTGSSESTHVKMPHCWKSRVRAYDISRVYSQLKVSVVQNKKSVVALYVEFETVLKSYNLKARKCHNHTLSHAAFNSQCIISAV